MKDPQRDESIRRALEANGLDALVCRLPENVVLLAGYWPIIGRSAVVWPREGDPVLVAPEMEREPLDRATVTDIRTYDTWKLSDPSPDDSLRHILKDVALDLGLVGKRIGYEGSFEDISPTQKVLEPWQLGTAAQAMLRDIFGESLVDATNLLVGLRAIKTPLEIERIRVANEIAGFGLEAFRKSVASGVRECDVQAAVESAVVARGTGYKSTHHARAQAVVFSGAERLWRWGWGLGTTSDRLIRPGDLVMLELSTVADGYYSDLTRMIAVPPVAPQVQEAYDACLAANQAAIAAVRAGATGRDVDAAARAVLASRGYAAEFIHHTGHGVGFRYHEPIPFLHPSVEGQLAIGMVHTIEPGIYSQEFGGMRVEDNVLVAATGAEVLSDFTRALVVE